MGKFTPLSIFSVLILGWSTVACAHKQTIHLDLSQQEQGAHEAQIWTAEGQPARFDDLREALKAHSVIVLGENHGFKTHQRQHIQILEALRSLGRRVHVGMEFFYYPQQSQVDSFRQGRVSEAEFLKSISWGSPSFDFYRDQVLFPRYELGERTWALNAPRSVTSQVARVGVAQLSADLKALLPPEFAVGSESYRERFYKVMSEHVTDPRLLQNYFEAQSVWDDTMAWRVKTFQTLHPNDVMVIVVGEFHVGFGGGLPDRLKARGVKGIMTLSQVDTKGLTKEEVQKQVQPDAQYGPRADWIWSAPALD
jgi:uncharacterized iron-regulated protein